MRLTNEQNQWPGSKAPAAGPEGVGLCKAIKGFAKWSREIMIPGSELSETFVYFLLD